MLHFAPFPHSFSHAILDAILCDIGEFHCGDGKACVPEAWLCDGEPDCPDDSDETNTICKSAIPSITHQCKRVLYSCQSWISQHLCSEHCVHRSAEFDISNVKRYKMGGHK